MIGCRGCQLARRFAWQELAVSVQPPVCGPIAANALACARFAIFGSDRPRECDNDVIREHRFACD
jgi:hypothetical protein